MSFELCRRNFEQRLPGVAVILSSAFEPLSTMDGSTCRSDHSSPRYFPYSLPRPPRKPCIDLPPEQNPPRESSYSHCTGSFVSAGAQGFEPSGLRHQHGEFHRQSSSCYQVQPPWRPDVPGPRLEVLNNIEPREGSQLKLHKQWPEPQQKQHADEMRVGLQRIEPHRSNDERLKTTLNDGTDRSCLSYISLSKGSVPLFSNGPTPFRDALQTSIPATESTPWVHSQLPQQSPKYWQDSHPNPHRYQPGSRWHFSGSINQTNRTAFDHSDTYPSPRQQLSAFPPSISPPYSAVRSALPTIGHVPLTPHESTPDPLPEEKVTETYPSPPSTDRSFRQISSFAPLPLSLEDLVDPAPVKSDTVDDDVRMSGQILVGLAKGRTPVLGLGVGSDCPPTKMSSVTVSADETLNEAEAAGERDESEDGSESNDEIIPTTRTPSPMPVYRSAEATLTQLKRTKKRASTLPVSATSTATEPSFRRSWTRGLPSASGSVSTPVTKTASSSQIPIEPTAVTSSGSVGTSSSGSVGTSDRSTKSVTPKNSKRRTKKPKTKVSMENYDPEHPRPFGCDMCLERFLRKNDYVRHQRIHSGDKPYVCPICSTGFMRNDALLRHIDHTSVCAAQAPSREEYVFGLGGLKRRKSFSISTASESSHARNHKKRKV
ncbi:zinc finger protein 740 [Phaffia rhodozyma]|uniref:Zinc finger protein 740 n=1 Tax=Phaffia rhodozyma TaxID=264483 RepID=A0A0F7SIQ0_PHARH|nr:zinc finger protein 740 [Phaffia rhodozyma]